MNVDTLEKVVYMLIAAAIAVLTLVYVGDNILDQPDVHFSNSTGECVKVINYGDDEYSCDNIPKRYNHVWVL